MLNIDEKLYKEMYEKNYELNKKSGGLDFLNDKNNL